MMDHIDPVHALGFAIGAIFGYAHLWFLTKQNRKDIDILWKKHDDLGKEVREDLKKVDEKLSLMASALSRIEGSLLGMNKNNS